MSEERKRKDQVWLSGKQSVLPRSFFLVLRLKVIQTVLYNKLIKTHGVKLDSFKLVHFCGIRSQGVTQLLNFFYQKNPVMREMVSKFLCC